MNKFFITTALVTCISLGACSSLPNLPAQITTVQSETTAIAEALCQFEPTAATISGVVASLFPGGGAIDTVATAVAKAICQAVGPAPTAAAAARLRSAAPPMVNGVLIEGHFVPLSVKRAMKRKLQINGVVIEGQYVQ